MKTRNDQGSIDIYIYIYIYSSLEEYFFCTILLETLVGLYFWCLSQLVAVSSAVKPVSCQIWKLSTTHVHVHGAAFRNFDI